MRTRPTSPCRVRWWWSCGQPTSWPSRLPSVQTCMPKSLSSRLALVYGGTPVQHQRAIQRQGCPFLMTTTARNSTP
ncbi:hypothetical protein MRX96_056016 [Rhipicephalus microplus]